MPPKIRDLVQELEQAGFCNRGGKGSHRNFIHPHLKKSLTLSGNLGNDAKKYQIIDVREAIKEVNDER